MQSHHIATPDVRIYLRGRDVAVAEQRLDHSQIGAALQQVRRERVAQDVRGERPGDAGVHRVVTHHPPERLPRHAAPAMGNEQDRLVRLGPLRPHLGEVALDQGPSRLAERHHPALTALAQHRQVAAAQLEVGQLQRAQLRHAQTRGVHGVQHRRVAQAARGGGVGRGQQGPHVVGSEQARQLAAALGRGDQLHRIARDQPLLDEVTIQAAQTGDQAGLRARVEASLAEHAEHVGDGGAVSVGKGTPGGGEHRANALQIRRVRRDRGPGEAALHLYMQEVAVEHVIGALHHRPRVARTPDRAQQSASAADAGPFPCPACRALLARRGARAHSERGCEHDR